MAAIFNRGGDTVTCAGELGPSGIRATRTPASLSDLEGGGCAALSKKTKGCRFFALAWRYDARFYRLRHHCLIFIQTSMSDVNPFQIRLGTLSLAASCSPLLC